MGELWRAGSRGLAARRAAVGAVVLVLAAAALAVAAPSARSAARAGGVPWRLAGPGWSVVDYSAASLKGTAKSRLRFYLVSPAGRRYLFYMTPAATAYPELTLLDWSGDRQRVLAYSDVGSSSTTTAVEQIGLATGKIASRFKLPAGLSPDGYTRPRGHSMFAEYLNKPGIYRYDLTGHLQRILARRTWLGILHVLDSPAGTFLVAGGEGRMLRISNAGEITGRTPIPQSSLCGPNRWWTATTVLADCFGRGPDATDRLWLVPARGGAAKPLTPALRPHGLFQGYVDAWTLGRQLYLQADNAHDTLSIVRQFADGTRRTITVPGRAGVSDDIVAAYHGRLLLLSNIGPGGPSSLFWFNPVTRAEQFIFRAPAGTYGVAGVLPYGYWSSS